MPDLPDDDVDSIKEGTYVYWMDQDEDVPRGSLGEVIEVDGEDRKVEFPKCKHKVAATKLNVSDFQKGTFVHFTNHDDLDEMLGEVKGLDDGRLVIKYDDGKKMKEKPKYLLKCDFQPGMFVFWKLEDKDVRAGDVGQVQDDVDSRGKMKVNFPQRSWYFRPRDLIRASVQPGSYVQWTESDDEIGVGEIGEATGEISSSGKIRCAFSKGTWSFKHDSLVLCELQLGSMVRWQKIDDDVKKGDLGQVVGIKVSQSRLRVQFPKGRWKFRPNELNLCRIQPGNLVTWSQSDEDIPRGDIGEVIRLDGNSLSIQWPKGHWSMRINEVVKLRFQKGDRVQWTQSDDDILEGHIGVVMGVKYSEDSGRKLYVNWPKGRWSMKPHTLLALNFDTDGAHQLKLAFKRFDQDGDGRLSEDELVSVLSNLGSEGGGLAPSECRELFKALDKDHNGKLSVSEFIDYVFSASSATKVVLADGFGLDASLGFADQEEERWPEDDDDEDKGQPFDGPEELKSSFASASEGIDENTEVSRAEWATAMLSVGIPRAAALASFDAVLEELGGGEVKVKDLAAELNGMGGSAGVGELRDPVGKVKQGQVELIDLQTPAEEVEFERDLAKRTGIDGLIFDLMYNDRPLEEAAEFFPKAKLSELERKVLGEMSEEDLVKAVAKGFESSETLSAVASWQRARENCQREIQEIIDRCKSEGTQFIDDSFNPLENESTVLYVDKKKPGYDCTVDKPHGWKRPADLYHWTKEGSVVAQDGAQWSDVKQGSIGDCFAVAAFAAMAACRKSFLRQALVAYDMEVGVYGVMFCEEMHFTYEILDTLFGVKDGGTLAYARSPNWGGELWVSMIEKAYFKHMTCLEMCDGGTTAETVFSFLGGVWGVYPITDTDFSHPSRYWKKINTGLENGEIMTSGFHKPSKGKYAHGESGPDGQCGEHGAGMGLVEGHAYSVLRSGEVDGHKLICFRNPWAHREWTGPWSDDSSKWTDERKEKLGHKKSNDGAFWMEDEDCVQVLKRIRFNRTFGPTWQCCAQYGHFGKAPPYTAMAKNSYRACEDDEISFKRGDVIEVTKVTGETWLVGVHKETGNKGYFRKKDVDLRCEDTFKYELTVSNVSPDARIIVGVFRQNQKKMREWYKRRDGMHYKDTDYPTAYLHIYDASGKRLVKHKLTDDDRCGWKYLKPSRGPFTMYIACKSTQHKRFALYAFAPHGQLRWKQLECDRGIFASEVGGAGGAVHEIREFIYDQTHTVLNEYFHLGKELLSGNPEIAGKIMAVASTVGEIIDAEGIRDVAEDAADQVRTLMNSDEVQNVTSQVGDQAQELANQVGNLMNRASSWFG